MKPFAPSHRPKPEREPRGFALIVTLSLMILLTVIAVGLLSLSSITLRASGQGQAMQTARANARLALMLALGDLQKSLGPDARMSARAETLAKDTRVGATVAANTPKAWWLGASHSDGVTPLGKDASESVKWLISGLPNGSLASTLTNPVDMIRGGSLDLSQFTGGAPIQAGRVPIASPTGQVVGNYAYFVDDNGMKAQLAASHPDVRNDNPANLAGGVIPGTYPISQLRNLTGSGTGDVALVQKLGSTRDLELIGVSKTIAKEKFFAYTTRSLGVLSDTRAGGLKKDLTIAFENPKVFEAVFPASDPDKFITITPDKLSQASELATNGYINWAIFRDYYNLKTQIKDKAGMQYLPPTLFASKDFVATYGGILDKDYTPFYSGALGPHQMKGTGLHANMPYGAYNASRGGNAVSGSFGDAYVYNPIFPIMLELWQKSWLGTTYKKDEPKEGAPEPPYAAIPANFLQTNVQLFTSHYNPYNVGIWTRGDKEDRGPRVIKFPQVLIDVRSSSGSGSSPNGSIFKVADPKLVFRDQLMTLLPKLQASVNNAVMLEPGRSHVAGFSRTRSKGKSSDNNVYGDNVGDITNKSVYEDRLLNITKAMGAEKFTVITEYAMREPAFAQGADNDATVKVGGEDFDPEFGQVFFSLLAVDAVDGFDGTTTKRPGKKFTDSLARSDMNINSAKVIQISLRTTNEGSRGLRPLVDANIRAQWNNPKWDAKMDLPGLAAYTLKFTGDADEPPLFLNMKTGGSAADDVRGFSFWGSGRTSSDGYDRVILFDVPRRDLLSLGQLQHAGAGRFSYEPTYIVGNSYANPRISLGNWKESVKDDFSSSSRGNDLWKISGNFDLYDASYLVNELIWDSYTFSTIPQKDDNVGGGDVVANDIPALLSRSKHLPNPRFVPYEPKGSEFTTANLQMVGDATKGSFFHNAGHLLVDGAFNVNSTSVDAWEAFLTGTLNLPVRKVDEKGVITKYEPVEGVRYPRAAAPEGDGMKTASLDENYWTGFRELTGDEVRSIATEVVKEIKERGPFLTLGSFVNRKIGTDKNARSGALQVALDNTVNNNLDSSFQSPADNSVVKTLPANGNQGAGFPGQLLQGDVLQALGPYMTVHSDTFTIRAYGEAKNGTTITAKAYCEAVVQRSPDPVDSGTSSGTALANLVLPSSPFGRQFSIVSFRWLNEAEI